MYTDRKKMTYLPVAVTKGSCSVILTKERKGQDFLKINANSKSSHRSKLSLKWNTFQWLIENRKGKNE